MKRPFAEHLKMKQQSAEQAVSQARSHFRGNKRELEESKRAGCATCCAEFDAKEVTEWHDEWVSPERQNRVKRWTAKCPCCKAPTVIPSASGLLRDEAYLPIVNGLMRISD